MACQAATSAGEDAEKRPSHAGGWAVKRTAAVGSVAGPLPATELPRAPAIPLLGTHPGD